MSASVRAALVVAVVAIATLGQGGTSAASLLAQHLLVAIAVLLTAAFPDSEHTLPRGPSIAWLIFAGLAAAGALLAPYAYAAWLVLVEIAAFGAMAAISSRDSAALSRVVPHGIALLAAGHGAAALAQRLMGEPRPASTFLNPNHLAAWLAAATLFLAGPVVRRQQAPVARWAHGAAMLLALAGIFATASRGAVLGLAAGAAALVAVVTGELSQRARRGMLAAAGVIAIAMGVGIALRFRGAVDPYPYHRSKIWASAFHAALDAPLTGTGPGQFAAAAPNLNFPLENAPLRYERTFRTPHSDVLRAVCEFGFPAGLAAFAALALAASGVFRRRRGLTDVECGALAALVGLFAQACVDDLSTRPAITMTGAVFAGLLLARRVERGAGERSRVAGFAVATLFVLGLGVAEVADFIGWSLVNDLPRGRLDARQLETLRRGIAWNPMRPDSWQRMAEHYVADGRSASLSDYAAAREAAEHARRLQPKDAFYARAEARVEAGACLTLFPFEATRERARLLYESALACARTDATIPLEESNFLLQAADPAGARRAAELALRIEPNAATPRLCLAQAILQLEGPAGAGRARQLVDEAEARSLRSGERPASPYDAALRTVDPRRVDAIRSSLGRSP